MLSPVILSLTLAGVNSHSVYVSSRGQVPLEDLIDAVEVAEILGLARRTAVSVYQDRYPDMPRPVIDLGPGRPRLWLKPDIEDWAKQRREARGR